MITMAKNTRSNEMTGLYREDKNFRLLTHLLKDLYRETKSWELIEEMFTERYIEVKHSKLVMKKINKVYFNDSVKVEKELFNKFLEIRRYVKWLNANY